MTYRTDDYQGLIAETISVQGHRGDYVHAYYARPAGPGPFPYCEPVEVEVEIAVEVMADIDCDTGIR